MPKLIYYRIAGNVVTLSMHSINSLVMLTALQNDRLMKDPEIRNMASMQSRFVTLWNVVFQIAYASLALTCDVLTLVNKDHLLPKPIKKFRDGFFSAVVFPGTLTIFTIFWPIYIYDRQLIFPRFIDKVLPTKSNFVMHLAILPVVLWELAFQPRRKPRSHLFNLSVLFLYYVVYSIHIHVTYNERGVWPYPMLHKIYGTIYYLYLHVYISLLFLASYYIQWPLYTKICGYKKISEKVN